MTQTLHPEPRPKDRNNAKAHAIANSGATENWDVREWWLGPWKKKDKPPKYNWTS